MNNQRSLFEIPDEVAYFNAAGISPLLKEVRDAGLKGVNRKAQPWTIQASDFFDEPERVRSLFAKLIHADPDDIALVPSATYGAETLCRNLVLARDDEVLVSADEFPALILPLKRICQTFGAEMVTLQKPSSSDWTKTLLGHINSRTKVVATSAAHWTDGTKTDLEVISDAARKVGATLIVDLCQSVGAVDFDVRRVQPDFVLAATYKWLLGPYSSGFMYVSKRFQEGLPLEEYWASREGAHDFSKVSDYCPRYQFGARRFDVSERSNFINLPMVERALLQIHAWGVTNISNFLEPITREIGHAAKNKGYRVADPTTRHPHFLGISTDKRVDTKWIQELANRGIFVSLRANMIRISPHVYTTEKDVETLVDSL